MLSSLLPSSSSDRPRFKTQYSYSARLVESSRIRDKFSDRMPIICEKAPNQKTLPSIDKIKYLVPADLTVGQFMYVIRKRLKLPAEQALFFIINGNIPSSADMMSKIYSDDKDQDGFLYIGYMAENTFG